MKNYLLLFIATLLFGCTATEQSNEQFTIVTTTGLIGDAVKNIVGDRAKVISLMGPGVDPHLYKVTQGDLKKLTSANVILYNGLHLEGKMGEVLEKLSRTKPIIAVSDGIDRSKLHKVPQFNNNYDPHIWFDLRLWIQVVNFTNKELNKLLPEDSTFFNSNAKAYRFKLDTLNNWVKKEIAKIPKGQRVLITAHDAFGYFGDAYDIEVRGLQGISTLSEYGLKDIADLVTYITKNQVKAVFVETSVSERAIKSVVTGCNERGFDVIIGGYLFSDAMGREGTPEGTYLGMVEANVNTIVNALR